MLWSKGGTRGLTLVELLVVMSLLVILVGTVVSVIAGGLRIWQRFEGQQDESLWVVLAAHQMRGDLLNARIFELIPFEGTYRSIRYAGLVRGDDLDAASSDRELGQISYYWDSSERRLCRSEVPYRLLKRVRRPGCTTVVEDVQSVRFRFLAEATEGQKRRWVNRWEDAEPPLALRCEIERGRRGREGHFKHELTLGIPLGGGKGGEDD